MSFNSAVNIPSMSAPELLDAYDQHLCIVVDRQLQYPLPETSPLLDDPKSWIGYQTEQTGLDVDRAFTVMNELAGSRLKFSANRVIFDAATKELRRRRPNESTIADILDCSDNIDERRLMKAGLDLLVLGKAVRIMRKLAPMLDLELPLLDKASSSQSRMAMRAALNSQVWARSIGQARQRGINSHYVTMELNHGSTPVMRSTMAQALRLNAWYLRPEIETGVQYDNDR